ncbi:MAG: hypothetical protein Q4G10_01730 [Bacteroidia bacterium]|nr:hypothetical protein [Bacteroidia bacterium]
MKRSIRNIISILTLAVLAAVFLLINAGKAMKRSLITCEGVNVVFTDDYRFVTEDDIKGYLDKYYGAYIGQRVDSIKLHKVESILNRQSAILNSEAYTTDDGLLNITISQREPVARFQNAEMGFYADECGFIFPLQENYTSNVPVIDGNIPVKVEEGFKGAPENDKEKAWIEGVVELVRYMEKSRIWSENIVQMHVDDSGDLVLIPREGNERFIFGSPDGAEEKFGRVEKYYRYILPEKGEGYYRTVNVKFDKQIVCKK